MNSLLNHESYHVNSWGGGDLLMVLHLLVKIVPWHWSFSLSDFNILFQYHFLPVQPTLYLVVTVDFLSFSSSCLCSGFTSWRLLSFLLIIIILSFMKKLTHQVIYNQIFTFCPNFQTQFVSAGFLHLQFFLSLNFFHCICIEVPSNCWKLNKWMSYPEYKCNSEKHNI